MSAAVKRYFTPEEANQALPLVRAIVGDIVRQFRDVRERKERLEQIREMRGAKSRDAHDVYSEEVSQMEDELEKDASVLQGFIDELDKIGVQLKDVSRGLVDFPALMDGREVYLCWLLGEDDVTHWHELDAGFQGRQSLLADSMTGGDDLEQNS